MYINDWADNRDQCFDEIKVSCGETLDFDANVRIAGLKIADDQKARGRLMLVKNRGERVAQSWFASRTYWDHPGAALNYREQLDADATFTLCFTKQDFPDYDGVRITQN